MPSLLGTGDGRMFAVIAPATKSEYRVTSIDPNAATTGATILVPTAFGLDPESPAGFALWGSSLLVFTTKALTRYDFATGTVSSPEIVPGHYGTFPLLTGTPEALRRELARIGVSATVHEGEPGEVVRAFG